MLAERRDLLGEESSSPLTVPLTVALRPKLDLLFRQKPRWSVWELLAA